MLPSFEPRKSRMAVPSLFEELFNTPVFSSGFTPALDLREDKEAYHIDLEVPGVSKDDIKISLKENVLTIKGEKKHESKQEQDGSYRFERSYGSFERSVRFSNPINEEAIEAKLNDGVLKLRLPKTEDQGIKQITVN